MNRHRQWQISSFAGPIAVILGSLLFVIIPMGIAEFQKNSMEIQQQSSRNNDMNASTATIRVSDEQ